MSKHLGALIIFLIVSTLTFFLLKYDFSFVESIENKTWDYRVLFTANKNNADKRIKLIDINQTSLDVFEREYSLTWPLPRSVYSRIISFLSRANAKGLAFDMLFTESAVGTVDADKEFAQAVQGKLPVVTALALDSVEREVDYNKFKLFSDKQLKKNFPSSLFKYSKQYSSVTLPIPELIFGSAALGNVQADPDRDGVFRHYFMGGIIHNVPVLSLPFAFYELTNGLSNDYGSGPLIVRQHGGINTYQTFSLIDIVQAEIAIEEGSMPLIDPTIFNESWIILGTTAPGLLDLRPTSLESRGGGLHYVAAVLDNIINNDFVKRESDKFVYLISLSLIVLTLFSTLFGAKLSLHLLRVFALLIFFLAIAFVLAFIGIWLPIVIPTNAILLSAFLGIALQYQVEGRQHRFIRNAFKYYVSPSVVEQIAAEPERLKLGGEKREVTIFFSDIVGFTSIAERLAPEQLVKMLNDYLTLFTNIIQKSEGTVDKYVGDAVMAYWNAPLNIEDHAVRAVQTAIECQKELLNKKKYFEDIYGVYPDTRIGINTAEVTVGNFGSKERFDYTLIGDGVNLASRLEGANKKFGTRILISENCVSKLPSGFKHRAVADLIVLGKSKSIRVYEPFYGQENFSEEIKINLVNLSEK